MGIMSTYLFAAILCLSFTLGEDFNFGEFMSNIPGQVESAWDRMVEAIKQPVRIQRHFIRNSKPKTIFKAGPIEYSPIKTLPVPPYKIEDIQNHTSISMIPLISPVEEEITTRNAKPKVTIPIVGARNRYWNMIPHMQPKEQKCNNLGICDAGFQEYADMKPFKYKDIGYKDHDKSEDYFQYVTPGKKVLIPIVSQPRYSNVNQWNNMQRPSFAQIKSISPGDKRTIASKMLEFLYNGKISEPENVMDNEINSIYKR